MKTFARNALAAMGVGALSLGLASPALGQDFKTALPEDTILYIGAPDIPSAMEAFKTSALFKMWKEEEVQEFFESLLEEADKQYEQGLAMAKQMHQNGVIPVDPDEILKVKIHGIHVALTELSLDMEKGSKLNFCVCIDFGQSGDKAQMIMAALLNLAKAQAGGMMPEIVKTKLEGAELNSLTPPDAPPMMPQGFGIHWSFIGGKLVLGTSQDAMKNIVQGLAKGGLEKNLTTSAAYASVASKTRPQPYGFEAFMRPDSMWTTLWAGLALAKQMNPDDMAPVDIDGIKRAADALGLLNTTAIGVASSYENGKGVDRWFAKTEGEPKGLMKLVGAGTIDLAQLDYIPKDASNFSITRFEPSVVYDSLFAAVNAYDKNIGEMVKMKLGEAQDQIGINIREDFFANMGPEMLSYSMPVSGNQLPEMGFLVKVKDSAKALKVLQTASAMSQGAFTINDIDVEGGKLYGIDMDLPDEMAPITAMIEPTFTFHKGYMILGLTRGDVRGALKMLNGKGGASIKENAAFKPYLEKIPQSISSLGWRDTAADFEGVYGVLASAAGLIPLPEEIPLDLGLLPSTETLTQHLFGSFYYSKKLPDGFMTKMVGPVGPELYLAAGLVGAAMVPAAMFFARQADGAFPGGGGGGMFRAPQAQAAELEAVEEVEAAEPEPAPEPVKRK
jgi:hypothetical protein